MNNQQRGKEFEKKFIKWLSRCGCWAHFMNPAPDGSQPFDIIALAPTITPGCAVVHAFDCKTLDGDRFPLSRIEENQEMAFTALNRIGVHNTYFVIDCGNNLCRLIPSQAAIEAKKKGKKSIMVDGYESFYIE